MQRFSSIGVLYRFETDAFIAGIGFCMAELALDNINRNAVWICLACLL